ncbi:reverse transcriptase domain-containing protein [Tanacetum coccineum]|uniref:Reverse transcriptase domain-containing protein n=1 Tax=Tanacetum coccineum TaxID=301880 RepID=A0ABQ4YS80_9ASTR
MELTRAVNLNKLSLSSPKYTSSGVLFKGATNSSSSLYDENEPLTEKETEVTKDKVLPSTKDIQPPVIQKSHDPVKPVSSPISPEPSSAQVDNSPPSKEPSKETKLPYPSRVEHEKKGENDKVQIQKFWEMFKKIHVDITLADALILMPKYQKMLKSLLSNKESECDWQRHSNECYCSERSFSKSFPRKSLVTDDFSFLLGLPALQSTRMTLELANCSLCVPKGIARDVLVLVGRLTFPADFVVVDFECDYRVPLILGRPFLRTARTLIDVFGEEMSLRTDEERLIISVRSEELKYTTRPHKESVCMINISSSEVVTCDFLTTNGDPITPSSTIPTKEALTNGNVEKHEEVEGEKNLDVKTIVSFFAPIGNCVRKWATNEFVKDNDEINHEVFKSNNENDLGVHDNEEEEIAFLDGLLEDENFFEINDKKVESFERKTKEVFETKVEPKKKKELQVFHPDIEILNHFENTWITFHEKSFEKDDKSSKELAPSKALLTLKIFDPLHPPLMDFHVTKAFSGFTFSLLKLFSKKFFEPGIKNATVYLSYLVWGGFHLSEFLHPHYYPP